MTAANLRVAVTQRVQQDGQWRDGETSYFKVNMWRGQAENLADSLAKVERTSQRGNGDRAQGRERAAERGGDFNEAPPF
jgi:single-strand DNA-binding protein